MLLFNMSYRVRFPLYPIQVSSLFLEGRNVETKIEKDLC
jgi:hypothetical protein